MNSSNLGYSFRAVGKKEMKGAIEAIKGPILLARALIGLFRVLTYGFGLHIYTSPAATFFLLSLQR